MRNDDAGISILKKNIRIDLPRRSKTTAIYARYGVFEICQSHRFIFVRLVLRRWRYTRIARNIPFHIFGVFSLLVGIFMRHYLLLLLSRGFR
jgi:hypothetical protein